MQNHDEDLVETAKELQRVREQLAPLQDREAELAAQLQRIAAAAPTMIGPAGRAIARATGPKRLIGPDSVANSALLAIAEIGGDWIGFSEIRRYLQARRPELTDASINAALGRLGKDGKIEIDPSGKRWMYRKLQSGLRQRAPAPQPPANNGTHHSGAKRASRR